MNLQQLQQKPFFKIIKIILFLTLLGILTSIIIKNFSKINFKIILNHPLISVSVITIASIILLIKSYQLYTIASITQLKRPYFHFIKIYCMSSFIELTTFTGKIGSDGFKYLYWKEHSKKNRLTIILFQRSTDILGFIILLLFILIPWWISIPITLLIVILLIKCLSCPKKTQPSESIKHLIKQHRAKWLAMIAISIISYLLILTQLGLIFSSLGATITKPLLLGFLFSHGLGALSQLPLGLGVKDLFITYTLNDILNQETIILGLIWARLFGEFFIIMLGGIFLGIDLLKKKHSQKEQPEHHNPSQQSI